MTFAGLLLGASIGTSITVLFIAWVVLAYDDHRQRERHKLTFHGGTTCDC